MREEIISQEEVGLTHVLISWGRSGRGWKTLIYFMVKNVCMDMEN
jgi:hypothetical protein